MNSWAPDSWQSRTISQQPVYPDADAVDRVVGEMSNLPPLVTSWEVEALKSRLADVAAGRSFLLQGGDCAESFEGCEPDSIAANLKILLQMSLVLVHATKRRVVRVGRMAGQYAKPRSADTESRGEETLPSYRGDLVNRSGFTSKERVPDPELMLRGYERAALTLNFIRGLVDGGFADLHHPEYWNLDFVQHSESRMEYERIVEALRDSIEFMENVLESPVSSMRRTEFYTSHEGLALLYEQAQTRQVPRREGWYNLSTHFPWLGKRTTQLDGAHVEYFRGIRNPIGVKVGPGMESDHLKRLIDVLHPDDEPGRLTLIHRFGVGQIDQELPAVIEAVKATGKSVVWCVDPMHGNTESTANGMKTRRFENILGELRQAFAIHDAHGTSVGGVHFEMTGQDVTECIGGARGLSETDLSTAYRSPVDPRLNYEQSLELGMLIAHHLRNG